MRFNSSYPYPLTIVLPAMARLLAGQPSSLAALAHSLVAGIEPGPQVQGRENIPSQQPFIAIWNHFENSRVDAWWGPLVLADAVALARPAAPREMRILMTREWWYPDLFGRTLKGPLTRWLFRRLAKSYGMVLVPPVLDTVSTRGQGIGAVRQALAVTRDWPPQLVGLAPEAGTGPGGTLRKPPSGVGLFLSLLSDGRIPLLPAAWYEDLQPGIVARFGMPFLLDPPSRLLGRRERDRRLIEQAMCAIAALLPPQLRGVYA